MPYDGPRTLAEEREENARYEARARGDARCELETLCENIGKQLPSHAFHADNIGLVSDMVCECLYEHPEYKAILADGPGVDGYEIAADAMKRGAGIKIGEAA